VGMCLRVETLGSHCRLPRKDGADLYTCKGWGGKAIGQARPPDIVAVVQTAQAIMGKDATRAYGASSAPRCSFSQSKMHAVFVMGLLSTSGT